MGRQVYFVRRVISPADLQKDPDKFGGMSFKMAAAIQEAVYTVDLCDSKDGYGSCVSLRVNGEQARELKRCGKVELEASGYWLSSNDPRIKWFIPGTNTEVQRVDLPFGG